MSRLTRRQEDHLARHRVVFALAQELCNLLLHILLFGAALAPLALLLPKAQGPTQWLAALGGLCDTRSGGLSSRRRPARSSAYLGLGWFRQLPLGSKAAARWGLAMMVWMVFRKSPVRALCNSSEHLRHVVYAATGGQLHWSAVVGLGVDITDPWATRVGPGATLGDYCILNAHEISGGVANCEPIFIGPNVTVGHHASISPGVFVEQEAIVGSGALVTKNTKIPGEVWGWHASKVSGCDRSSKTGKASILTATLLPLSARGPSARRRIALRRTHDRDFCTARNSHHLSR